MITTKHIVFQLNEKEYGTNIRDIISIERLPEVVSLPKVSDFIEGVAELRGEAIPVVDLRTRMELPKTEATDETRMLVAKIDELSVGFIVDAASDVIDIEDSDIEPAPTEMKGIDVKFLSGVAKLEERLLLIIDLAYVLNYEELSEVKQAVEEETEE